MYELINNVPLKIKEYKGHRVVTFRDIDTVHNRPEGTARKRFNDNRDHFIEGEDFFKVKCSEVRPFFGQTLPNGFNPKADIILITENGYLMLVKSLTDDLAWEVQRQLVNTYFKVKETGIPYAKIRNDIKEIVSEVLDEKIEAQNEKLKSLEQKIDSLEKKSGNISTETVQTLVPCFNLSDQKTDFLNNKIDVLEKKIDVLEKKSGSNAKENTKRFNLLDRKIRSAVNTSERASEKIIKTVTENTKSLAVYFETFIKMLK